MDKIKIYDFDKTLARGDSIAYLIKYARRKNIISFFGLLSLIISSCFKYLFSFRFESFKSFAAKLLANFSEDEIRNFVAWHLEENGYWNLISDIGEEGYITILCSASLEGYVKIAAEMMGFDHYIGTRHDDRKIIGKNNAREEKLRRLEKLFRAEDIEVDYEKSKAYTDSYKNDRFMAEPCGQKFLVNSKVQVEGFENIRGQFK